MKNLKLRELCAASAIIAAVVIIWGGFIFVLGATLFEYLRQFFA